LAATPIHHASPVDYNVSEIVSSFNYCTRCKDIANKVSVSGPGLQQAQVTAMKKELNKLKKHASGGPPSGPPPTGPGMTNKSVGQT
jgi:hypothetical protein